MDYSESDDKLRQYDYLHNKMKITPKRISYQFSASMPDESIKKQLHLTSATAILTCAHVSWCIKDGKEIPFEHIIVQKTSASVASNIGLGSVGLMYMKNTAGDSK